MIAQHPHSIAARVLAILAVALTFVFVFASSAARPASADLTKWTRNQAQWSHQSGSWRQDWHGHKHWKHNKHRKHSKQWHHKPRRCFGCGPQIVLGGNGVFFASPGFVIVQPGFIVRQPRFVHRQPGFIRRHPKVFHHPRFFHQRPGFVVQQKDFLRRHPSLHLPSVRPGLQPLRLGLQPLRPRRLHTPHGGVQFITPGVN